MADRETHRAGDPYRSAVVHNAAQCSTAAAPLDTIRSKHTDLFGILELLLQIIPLFGRSCRFHCRTRPDLLWFVLYQVQTGWRITLYEPLHRQTETTNVLFNPETYTQTTHLFDYWQPYFWPYILCCASDYQYLAECWIPFPVLDTVQISAW